MRRYDDHPTLGDFGCFAAAVVAIVTFVLAAFPVVHHVMKWRERIVDGWFR